MAVIWSSITTPRWIAKVRCSVFLGKRWYQLGVRCCCLLILLCVALYCYITQLYPSTPSIQTKTATLVDFNKHKRISDKNKTFNMPLKREFIFHQIDNCISAPNCSKKNAKSCSVGELRTGLKCKHMMALGNKNMGRVGNQMFQVAALLGIASLHDYTAIIHPSMAITSLFDLPNVAHIKLENVAVLGEKACCIYNNKASNLSHAFNWTLRGYFQSWRYFEGAQHIVKRAFRLKDKYAKQADSFIKSVISNNVRVKTIGVHVRRGDFTLSSAERNGYSMAPLDYIQRAMTYVRNKYNQVHFFIVSDDQVWCGRNIRGENITITPSSTVIGFHMAVLIRCNHVVVTSGTFGWWGAWMSGGDVVYWKGYPGKNTSLDRQTRREDYYPSTWLGFP